MIHEDPVSRLALKSWTDGHKYVVAHISAPVEFRMNAALVGTNEEIFEFIRSFKESGPGSFGAIYLAGPSSDTEDALIVKLNSLRPNLEFFKLKLAADDMGRYASDSKEQNNSWHGANYSRGRKARVRADQLF